MTQKKSNPVISVKIDYTLHDWSESLSFDDINDTLFLIGLYHDPNYVNALSASDRALIEKWMTKNDVNKFIKAKELAYMAYGESLEKEQFAAEIIGMPYKRRLSH